MGTVQVLSHTYDRIFLAFSGGKDSIACYLHILDQGIDPKSIELHHHCVDGREGSSLMDWPVTEAYCEAFAKHFGSPIYFSWKERGFEGEMFRENSRTKPIKWQNPDGTISQKGGTGGKESTRRMFPQVSASLSVRWCSA
jgi:tRNA(Ile)-lysidine synthase TilS/MesJ